MVVSFTFYRRILKFYIDLCEKQLIYERIQNTPPHPLAVLQEQTRLPYTETHGLHRVHKQICRHVQGQRKDYLADRLRGKVGV